MPKIGQDFPQIVGLAKPTSDAAAQSPDNMTTDIIFDATGVPFSALLWGCEDDSPEWVSDEDVVLIEDVEHVISIVAAVKRSESTKRQYDYHFERMRSQKKYPEHIINCPGSFYAYRGAFVWGMTGHASRMLVRAGKALQEWDQSAWERAIRMLRKTKAELDRYPAQVQFEGTSRFQKKKGAPKHHESKRRNARKLPHDWQDRVWNGLSKKTKNRAAIAVLMIVCPRPCELIKGVKVSSDGQYLIIDVEGGNIYEGQRGQVLRGIKVLVVSQEAQYLKELANHNGGGSGCSCDEHLRVIETHQSHRKACAG